MKTSIAIIGLGSIGLELIKQFSQNESIELIGLDSSKDNVIKASVYIKNIFISDTTDLTALQELGIKYVNYVIICYCNNLTKTILTTINLDKLRINNIIVGIDDDNYRDTIEKLGATYVFNPNYYCALKIINFVLHPKFNEFMRVGNNYCFAQLTINKNTKIKANNILLVIRNNEEINLQDYNQLKPLDEVILFGKTKEILELLKDE